MTTIRRADGHKEIARAHDAVRLGSTGPAVEHVQRQLNKKGARLAVDGIFGPKTHAAVVHFQKVHGLAQDGVCGAQTLKKLDARGGQQPAKDVMLREGDQGKKVLGLEKNLGKLGYDVGAVDGKYDHDMAKAVLAFKHDENITRAHGGKMTAGQQQLVRRELKKLDHAPEQRQVIASKGRTRLNALTARVASSTGVGPGSPPRAVANVKSHLHSAGYDPKGKDGRFDVRTETAVKAFQKHAGLAQTGVVDAHTWRALSRSQVAVKHTDTAAAHKMMRNLVAVAERGAGGKRPQGRCLEAVQNYLDATHYGKAHQVPRFPVAHDFADFLNRDHNARKLGLERLNILNPDDAPPGAIIVVRAGTPGTHHPTAGDIVVRGHGDHLYNDGEMGYGGPGNFPRGNNFVLGVYVPKGGGHK